MFIAISTIFTAARLKTEPQFVQQRSWSAIVCQCIKYIHSDLNLVGNNGYQL